MALVQTSFAASALALSAVLLCIASGLTGLRLATSSTIEEPLPIGPVAGVKIVKELYGKINNTAVNRYTLVNGNGVSVQILSLGAIISSIKLPDKNGKFDDILLGYDKFDDWADPKKDQNFGATIGRVVNRIANASFELDGKRYQLYANSGGRTVSIHGGFRPWDRFIWNGTIKKDSLTMDMVSPDGDEGYPGTAHVKVDFKLTADNQLVVQMRVTTDKPTIVNMANHAYFNLAGQETGSDGVYNTMLAVNADRYTPGDDKNNVPTGVIAKVEGPLDLRKPHLMRGPLSKVDFDHSFVIARGGAAKDDLVYIAGAFHEASGRTMQVYCNQPGVQLYTANKFPVAGSNSSSSKPTIGKGGVQYVKHGGFALETQNLPDAIHHANFPSPVLRPGGVYKHNLVLKFGINKRSPLIDFTKAKASDLKYPGLKH